MRQLRNMLWLASMFISCYSFATAQGAVIVNQLGTSPPPDLDYSTWQSNFSATDQSPVTTGVQGARTYDVFSIPHSTFPAGADITRFNWQMGVGDPVDPANNPPGPLVATSYRVNFWSNEKPAGQSDQPKDALYSIDFEADAVHATFKGLEAVSPVGDVRRNRAFYDMSVDLPTPFRAAPDTLYWVSYMAFTPTFFPSHSWYGTHSTAGGQTWQDGLDIEGNLIQRFDRSGTRFFSLEGTNVREPAMRTLGPSAIYAVLDNDSDAVFDDLGDTALDALASLRLTVGEGDAAASNRMVRGIVKFALPDTPNPVNRLESATLRFFVEGIEGIPAGPLSLLHSLSDNDLDLLASDYEDASYTDTLLDLVQPTDVTGSYYELDVTDLVLADYLSDGANPLSAFRLQVNEASFFEDNLSNRYLLTMPGAEVDRPQLVLTFIPEPPTSLLAATALVGVLGFRRRLGATGFASALTGCP